MGLANLRYVGYDAGILEIVGTMKGRLMNVGATLEKRRRERGITYAELSRRTNINEDMTSRFCKGSSKPSGDQLLRMCAELDLEVEDFFEDSETPKVVA